MGPPNYSLCFPISINTIRKHQEIKENEREKETERDRDRKKMRIGVRVSTYIHGFC